MINNARGSQSSIIQNILKNQKMIFKLAKNDFKTKYAGSYFGVFWAFVQPVVTICIYLFVFQVIGRAAPTETGYPYVLYLIAGIIPWFFFAEALVNATNCLPEYSYLVKKMVFQIDILPVIKVMSALAVHVFFVFITIIIYALAGYMPDLALIQVLYYGFCSICLVLAVSYFTASVTPFFKDTTQIINVCTSIGMWLTPIMWSEKDVPEIVMKILRFNPVYYIVTGYRDAFIEGTWFWERVGATAYFWLITIILFAVSTKIYKNLKVHFADVL